MRFLIGITFFLTLSHFGHGQEKPKTKAFWESTGDFMTTNHFHKIANYCFKQSFKIDSSIVTQRKIAENFRTWKKFPDAQGVYEQIVERPEHVMEDYFILSQLFYLNKKYSEARELFVQKMDPNSSMDDEFHLTWKYHLENLNPLPPPTQEGEEKVNRYCVGMFSSSAMNYNPTGVVSVWVSDEGEEFNQQSFKVCFKKPGIHFLSLHQFDDLTQTVMKDVDRLEFHFLERNYFDYTPLEGKSYEFSVTDYIPEEIDPVYVLWDFGDGYLGHGVTTQHQFESTGVVQVKAYVYSIINDAPELCAGIERKMGVRK